MTGIAKREAILFQVEQALVSAKCALIVESEASGDPGTFPALLIFDQGQRSSSDESEVGSTRYFMDVLIEGFVTGGTGAEARALRNDLYLKTVTALMAWQPLHELVDGLDEEDLRVDIAQLADVRSLAFSLTIKIEFSAPRESPVLAQP